jgi:hypothetical protein
MPNCASLCLLASHPEHHLLPAVAALEAWTDMIVTSACRRDARDAFEHGAPPPPPPSLCRVELDRLWRCGERRASLRRACATRDHAQTAPPALPPPVTLRPARAPRPAGAMAEQRPRRRVCCGSQRRRARERRLGFRLRGGSRGATPPHDSHQGPPSPSHQPPPPSPVPLACAAPTPSRPPRAMASSPRHCSSPPQPPAPAPPSASRSPP